MKKIYTATLITALVLFGAYPVVSAWPDDQDKKCAELFSRLADACRLPAASNSAKPIDLSSEPAASRTVLQRIRAAGPHGVLVVNQRLLSDQGIREELADSRAHVVVSSTVDPKTVQALLATPVRSVRVVALLPDTEIGVKEVFGNDNPDPGAVVAYMRKVRRTIARLPSSEVLGSPAGDRRLADQLLDRLGAGAEGELVCLVCHNDKGIIPLPDGSRITVEQAQAALHGHGIVLTCKSLDAGQRAAPTVLTTRDMEFDEMAKALVAVHRGESFGPDRNLGQFLSRMNRQLNAAKGPADTAVKLVTVSAGGGLLVLVACQLSKTDCTCPAGCDCCRNSAEQSGGRTCCQRRCCKK